MWSTQSDLIYESISFSVDILHISREYYVNNPRLGMKYVAYEVEFPWWLTWRGNICKYTHTVVYKVFCRVFCYCYKYVCIWTVSYWDANATIDMSLCVFVFMIYVVYSRISKYQLGFLYHANTLSSSSILSTHVARISMDILYFSVQTVRTHLRICSGISPT